MALTENLVDGRLLMDREAIVESICNVINDAVNDAYADQGHPYDPNNNPDPLPDFSNEVIDSMRSVDDPNGMLELFGMIIMRSSGTARALDAMITMLMDAYPSQLSSIYTDMFKSVVETNGEFYYIGIAK